MVLDAPLEPKITASVLDPDPLSRFRFGLAGVLVASGSNIGGVAEMGYLFGKSFGANLFGGAHGGGRFFAGLEFEFMPFRIPITERWDLFQFGFIAGASTLAHAYGNIGSLYGGARAQIGLGPRLGIVASGRVNFGFAMIEAGIITRL